MLLLVLYVGRICDRYGCKWPSAAAVVFRASYCAGMVVLTIIESQPLFLIFPLLLLGASQAFSGTAQPTRMIHHSTPGYADESTNFMLVINYVASALGCVVFATIFGFFSPGEIGSVSRTMLDNGFIPTMVFSIAIL